VRAKTNRGGADSDEVVEGEGSAMPKINHYRCNQCEFSLPSGWGGCMYVEDDGGRRIICPHPIEWLRVAEVLGENRLQFR